MYMTSQLNLNLVGTLLGNQKSTIEIHPEISEHFYTIVGKSNPKLECSCVNAFLISGKNNFNLLLIFL